MAVRTAESWFFLKLKGTIANELDVEGGGSAHQSKIEAASLSIHQLLTDGVEANEANRAMVLLDQSIAPGATVDIDLYDWGTHNIGSGYGKDVLGQLAIFEEIVCLALVHTGGDGQLEVMNPTPGSGPATWVPQLTAAAGNALRDGGCLVLYQPGDEAYDIFDFVNNKLRLGAVGDFVTFSIFVLGRSELDVSSSSTSSTSTRSSRSSRSSSSTSSSTQSQSSGSTSSTSTQTVE